MSHSGVPGVYTVHTQLVSIHSSAPLTRQIPPGKGLAAQIAASINAKKNFTKADEEQLLVNPAQAPPCKVEEEIEINDLPQQARLVVGREQIMCTKLEIIII